MISKKCKYAINAMVYLTREYGKGPVPGREIADSLHISLKFLGTILSELKKAKMLHSRNGNRGGYYLYREPAEINLVEIIRKIDGPIALLPCVSLNYYEPCFECKTEENCGIRDIFINIRDNTLKILSEKTLDRLAAPLA